MVKLRKFIFTGLFGTLFSVGALAQSETQVVDLGTHLAEKITIPLSIKVNRMGVLKVRLIGVRADLDVSEALIQQNGVEVVLPSLLGTLNQTNVREAAVDPRYKVESLTVVATSGLNGSRGEYRIELWVDPTVGEPLPPNPPDPSQEGRKDTSSDLECVWNGRSFQPFTRQDRRPVGPLGYGFVMRLSCESAIQNSNNHIVCNWNGNTVQAFSAKTGNSLGDFGYGFYRLEDCNQTVKSARWDALCVWNGRKVSPLNVQKNQPIGVMRNGYQVLGDCIKAVEKSKPAEVCQWTQDAIMVHSVITGGISRPTRYSVLDQCIADL